MNEINPVPQPTPEVINFSRKVLERRLRELEARIFPRPERPKPPEVVLVITASEQLVYEQREKGRRQKEERDKRKKEFQLLQGGVKPPQDDE